MALPDEDHPADRPVERLVGRAQRDHRVARGVQERSGQVESLGQRGHGPHRHRPERSCHPGFAGEGLGPPFPDLHAGEPQSPDHLPHEMRPSATSLDQGNRPRRPRQLQDQAWHPGSAADVQQGGGRLGNDQQEEQRIQDQVNDPLRLGAIPRQTTDPVPAPQLLDEEPRARGEPGIDLDPQTLDPGGEGLPGATLPRHPGHDPARPGEGRCSLTYCKK